ncbi:hypothetical protein EB118_06965 [bacterium]|nr:hypothetical protein [bacterium]NDC94385.1 hypothetical protein [bacterium]NDD83926.1 hypothetical protein [bacterium]NDG29821.1 hypothetical protein [bacterium]
MVYKRLLREIRGLVTQQFSKPLLENDYLVQIDESNTRKVKAIIKAPYDSVYRHKFIRLDFTIPDNYPHSPPQVTFVNHDNVRIHPNMYEDGKCCASILNTWGDSKFEKWTSSMGIETVLLTFSSFFDNNPYTYEPGGRDDPSYTEFVLYYSWQTCLTRYLQYEKEPLFRQFIQNYMLLNIENIFTDLRHLCSVFQVGTYRTRCFEIGEYTIDYPRLVDIIQNFYNYIDYIDTTDTPVEYDEFANGNYNCGICYDTEGQPLDEQESLRVTLHCGHTFHKQCIIEHTKNNNNVCSMCRAELDEMDVQLLTKSSSSDWVINPLTKRKIKVNGKTYKYLVEIGTKFT